MTQALLSLSHVHVRLEGLSILENVDMTLHAGEMVTLVGPNGSGKTTLLKVALGLVPPTTGQVTRAQNLRIGYMPQKLFLEKSLPMDVLSFLTLTAKKDEALQALCDVAASSLMKRSLHVLSGGELQRVLLAKALLKNPNLLVLDEPLQGVDPTGQEALYQLLQSIKEQKKCALLLVSHDLYFVHRASDRVICLNHHVCCSGRPEDVRHDPKYRALFGYDLPEVLAPYAHHHDHHHDGAPDACPKMHPPGESS
jgi:zinc transport system ATP-binding protein